MLYKHTLLSRYWRSKPNTYSLSWLNPARKRYSDYATRLSSSSGWEVSIIIVTTTTSSSTRH